MKVSAGFVTFGGLFHSLSNCGAEKAPILCG
jgi:hypothetical protein